MTKPSPVNQLQKRAIQEFEKVANSDWDSAIPLSVLLERVNRVAIHLVPEEHGTNSKVKRTFTERSFRHYTTLGCIAPPEKEGRSSLYRFCHLVQALLVRKLLWLRVPAGQITSAMSERSTEEIERMLLGGIEVVAREEQNREPQSIGKTETWRRIPLRTGIEVHLSEDVSQLNETEIIEVVDRFERAIRRKLK